MSQARVHFPPCSACITIMCNLPKCPTVQDSSDTLWHRARAKQVANYSIVVSASLACAVSASLACAVCFISPDALLCMAHMMLCGVKLEPSKWPILPSLSLHHWRVQSASSPQTCKAHMLPCGAGQGPSKRLMLQLIYSETLHALKS